MIGFDKENTTANDYLKNKKYHLLLLLKDTLMKDGIFVSSRINTLKQVTFLLNLQVMLILSWIKDSGEIHKPGSDYPLEKYLQDYEEENNKLA